MYDVLANLKLVESSRICLHESHENKRLHKTRQIIEEEGILRHPPLAILMQNGQYLIIDGAHRTFALQALGCKHIPVQVVEHEDFHLDMWDHIVPVAAWLQSVEQDSVFRWETERLRETPVAEMKIGNNERFYLYPNENRQDDEWRMKLWRQLVDSYNYSHPVHRLPTGMLEWPDTGAALIRFPPISLAELERIVSEGHVLPAGVTRFEIDGRLLNLCIPISLLKQEQIEQEQWERLVKKWRETLRLYSKPVYMCDA
ncbi:bifunctional transcriptional regulator/O-phospho-L-serine synthase SbnI [Brevibacillus formosus]